MTASKRKADGQAMAQRKAASTVEADGSFLYYLYCVMESGAQGHALLSARRVRGIEEGEALFPVEADGLVAAVSRVPETTFREAALNALLQDLPRLTPVAVRHEEAIQALLPAAPAIVPMTLGAVYRSPERVQALLREDADRFRRLLARVHGKREWTVKVFRDAEKLVQAAETDSHALRRLAEEAAASAPGRAYLVRKQRERLVAAEASRFIQRRLDAIVSSFGPVATEVRIDDLPEAPNGAWSLVMKAAFLVETDKTEDFRAAAARADKENTPLGLNVELTGPWAPYSFVGNGRDDVH
jgi:hypothetical protein